MLKFFLWFGIAIVSWVGLVVVSVAWFLLSTPRPTNIKECLTTKMFEVRLCPGEKGYVRLNQISPNVRMAVIVSEDGSFYGHQGVDLDELKNSAEKNWTEGRFARGGSTITQQLAKNVYLSSEKSLLRKAREIVIALQLEKLLTKDEILEKYLNVVEFGQDLYGVQKAAQHYFKKPPSALSIVEGAYLAFLLPNPKKYSVSFRKKELTPFARKQIKVIVNRLLAFKKISAEQHAQAIATVPYLFGGTPPPMGEGAADEEAGSLEQLETSEEWNQQQQEESDTPSAEEGGVSGDEEAESI